MGKKVLLLGASGLLGRYLLKTVPDKYDIVSSRYCNCGVLTSITTDITDKDSIKRAFYVHKPEIVIHAAAIGAVDYCEKNPDHAMNVNVDGTRNVVEACKAFGSKIIFISTNAVFDGQNPPYREEDKTCPLSVYGKTKVLAEDIVRKMDNHVIVRTARLFGRTYQNGRDSWIQIVRKNLDNRKKMRIVTDDIANPTYARHLANSIWGMIDSMMGIYNCTGLDSVSMYEFVRRIVSYYKEKPENWVEPITSDQLPNGVMVRPADTTFDMSKLASTGIIVPGSITQSLFQLEEDYYDFALSY